MNQHKQAGKIVEAAVMPLLSELVAANGVALEYSKTDEERLQRAGQQAVDAKWPGRYAVVVSTSGEELQIGVRDMGRR